MSEIRKKELYLRFFARYMNALIPILFVATSVVGALRITVLSILWTNTEDTQEECTEEGTVVKDGVASNDLKIQKRSGGGCHNETVFDSWAVLDL